MAQYAELKACSDHAVEVMERLAHARQVKAALRELGIRQLGLRIEVPEKGVVQISGALYDPEDEQRIPDRVKTIAGVEKIRMDVVLIPAGGD
jgi:osmotically-inducible protein OsmY